jgi:hypothetical protein
MVCSVCEALEAELAQLEEIHDRTAIALRMTPKAAACERSRLLVEAERIAKLQLVDAQYDLSRHRSKGHPVSGI